MRKSKAHLIAATAKGSIAVKSGDSAAYGIQLQERYGLLYLSTGSSLLQIKSSAKGRCISALKKKRSKDTRDNVKNESHKLNKTITIVKRKSN